MMSAKIKGEKVFFWGVLSVVSRKSYGSFAFALNPVHMYIHIYIRLETQANSIGEHSGRRVVYFPT